MSTQNIRHVFDFNKALSDGPYAWPGGYPRYFITADGGALSFFAANECAGQIRDAIISSDRSSGWCVVAVDINWEDDALTCDHTGALIECAYPNDDTSDEHEEN